MALQIGLVGRSRTPQTCMRCNCLRTIVRCGSPPASPTQFALAGLGRVGAVISSRQLRPTRFRCTGSPHHYGVPALPRARIPSIRCEGALRTFFGHRRYLTPRAFTAGGALTEFAPTSDVLCRLAGTTGCRLQPIGSCRFRRSRFREGRRDAFTRLARTASSASGKGDAEHDPERLPSRQTPASLRLRAYPPHVVRKDNA